MLRPLLALAVAALLISCGDSDESCGFEDGTYLSNSHRVNGDCPDMETKLVSPGNGPPSECTQSIRYDDDCNVSVTRDCELDGNRARAVMSLVPHGNGYAGSVQYTLLSPNPQVSCSGLYNVTYTAQ